MAKMIPTSNALCRTCLYRDGKVNNSVTSTCGYYLITKNRRGCPVGMCDKYEKSTKENEQKKKEIYREALKKRMSIKAPRKNVINDFEHFERDRWSLERKKYGKGN